MSALELPVHIGRCVYCGRSKGRLTDEHIIPYGLNGNWKLVEASCDEHSEVTKRFEGAVLRGAFLPVRTKAGLRTRRKHNRPRTFPMRFTTSEGEVSLDLGATDHPGFLVFPIFGPPGHVPADSPIPGLELRHFGYIYHRPSLDRFKQKYSPKSASISFPDVMAFVRMLAKTSYCFAIARLGLDEVFDAPVLKLIKGDESEAGKWVGNLEGEPLNNAPNRIHQMTLVWNETRTSISVHLRLFALLQTPEYTVVLR